MAPHANGRMTTILRQIEYLCEYGGQSLPMAVRTAGISMSTYYRWREKQDAKSLDEEKLRNLEAGKTRQKAKSPSTQGPKTGEKEFKHYSREQMIAILREIDHMCVDGSQSLDSAVMNNGITLSTYYRWREKFGWMTMDDAERMQKLEEENKRLKQLVELWSATVGGVKATQSWTLQQERQAMRSF